MAYAVVGENDSALKSCRQSIRPRCAALQIAVVGTGAVRLMQVRDEERINEGFVQQRTVFKYPTQRCKPTKQRQTQNNMASMHLCMHAHAHTQTRDVMRDVSPKDAMHALYPHVTLIEHTHTHTHHLHPQAQAGSAAQPIPLPPLLPQIMFYAPRLRSSSVRASNQAAAQIDR